MPFLKTDRRHWGPPIKGPSEAVTAAISVMSYLDGGDTPAQKVVTTQLLEDGGRRWTDVDPQGWKAHNKRGNLLPAVNNSARARGRR